MKKIILFFAFIGLIIGIKAQDTLALGTCGANGNNLTWILTKDNTLTISGSGDMNYYAYFTDVPWNAYRPNIAIVLIEDGVTSIASAAFYNCINLTSVTLPKSVTKIGYSNVFTCCNSLLSINVDTHNLVYSTNDGILYNKAQDTLICCPGGKTEANAIPNTVTTIGDNAFNECSKLTSVTLPNSVITIRYTAFYHCNSLTSIIIPNSVTEIKYNAFLSCLNLVTVDIGKSVQTIEDWAFLGCSNLLSINVDTDNLAYSSNDGMLYDKLQTTLICCPGGRTKANSISNTVTTIGNWAFEGCFKLTFVTIPKSVTVIEDWAFYGCSNLDTIICKANNPPTIDNYTFYQVPQNALVYIPCNTLFLYQMYWGFTNYIEEGETPAVPINLNIADNGNGFEITWQNTAPLYKVIRNYDLIVTIDTNCYIDKNVVNGAKYCYNIIAVNEDCQSEYSEDVCKIFNGVGIVETHCNASLRVYPNPTNGQLRITNYELRENAEIQIFDIVGQSVGVYPCGRPEMAIDVSHLASGLYFLKTDGKVVKFVKK